MKAYGIIYVHVNKLNGKAYVGQTCQDPKRRFRTHAYKNCTVFHDALLKYGWINFETIQLMTCFNQKDLDFFEEYFIKKYNAVVPNGYNTLSIANGKVVFTDEMRRKIGENTSKHNKLRGPQYGFNTPRETVTIEENTYKICPDCKDLVNLKEFCNNQTTYDGLHHICRDCAKLRWIEYRAKNPSKKLSKRDWQKSYKKRKESMSEGAKRAYEANPSLKSDISKRNSKAIKAVHIETGETIVFESALKAKEQGFQNSNIGQAIKYNKPYKNYIWSFNK